MSTDTPGHDPVPGWGQPKPVPEPEEVTAPWPAEITPAETPWPAHAAEPAAPWPTGAEPAASEPGPEQPAPVAPWGPPEPAAPAPAWGAPPAPPAPPPPSAPLSAAPQQPPAPGAWGAPPPQQTPGWGAATPQQPPGGWGTPPQQASGWAPGDPGAPGGPPVGWAPAPAKSGGNGCLKGCLIAGAIGVVLLILLVIGVMVLGQRFVEDMGLNPDGTLTECALVSSADVSDALDGSAEALPLGGIVDATVGQLLDKRIIPDAEDCWIAGDDTATGRIARQSGDASGSFNAARDAARDGGYFAGGVSGLGDEAFCTGMSEAGSFGVLVRRGDTLVYVSLINAGFTDGSGFEINADGVTTSPETCAMAGEVAKKVR